MIVRVLSCVFRFLSWSVAVHKDSVGYVNELPCVPSPVLLPFCICLTSLVTQWAAPPSLAFFRNHKKTLATASLPVSLPSLLPWIFSRVICLSVCRGVIDCCRINCGYFFFFSVMSFCFKKIFPPVLFFFCRNFDVSLFLSSEVVVSLGKVR